MDWKMQISFDKETKYHGLCLDFQGNMNSVKETLINSFMLGNEETGKVTLS